MTIDTGRGDDPGSTTNGNPASTPRSIDGGIPPSDALATPASSPAGASAAAPSTGEPPSAAPSAAAAAAAASSPPSAPASTPGTVPIGGAPPSDTPTGIEQAPNGSTVGSRALRSPTPPSRYGTPSGHAGPGYAVVGTSAESVVLPEIVQRASAPGALDSRAWWSMTTTRAPELPTPLPWPPRRATSW